MEGVLKNVTIHRNSLSGEVGSVELTVICHDPGEAIIRKLVRDVGRRQYMALDADRYMAIERPPK